MLMGTKMRFNSKTVALGAAMVSAALLASCDITPESPVLAGDDGESSNEAVGTILPDPPSAHPPSSGHKNKKEAHPDMESSKPQDEQASEKGPE